jgi:hypothetical protein
MAQRPAILMLALVSACYQEPATAPGGPDAARAASGPTVTATDPFSAPQGTTLDVHVLGSGFDQGSNSEFALHGVVGPNIRTNRTSYVSAKELVANITVSADAVEALYDVIVTTSRGKKGIGTERFEVAAPQSIGTLGGNTLARAINDQKATVGYSMVGSSQHAFFAAVGAAMTDLGPGQAYDLDPSGTTAVGVSGSAVVWRNAGGTWTSSPLPDYGAGSRATSMALTSGGLLIGGSVGGRPALWRESGTGWTLQTFAVPTGFNGAWIEDVNELGQAVGIAREPYSKAYVWEVGGTPVALTPLAGDRLPFAFGINPAGTVVVGQSAGKAVYWKRAANGSWLPPQILESCGKAVDVNARGMMIGQGCQNATLWILSADGSFTRRRLPGLGGSADAPAVEAINNAESPVAAGKAKRQGSPIDEGVIWDLSHVATPGP